MGAACSLPAISPSHTDSHGSEDDTASPDWGEDRIRELACSGELPVYEICPCDVTIDWSGLTEDLWNNPVDPSQFETVALLLMTKGVSAESVSDSICADTYTAEGMQGYVDAPAEGRTSITLSEMSFLGTDYDPKTGSVLWLMWSGSRQMGMDIDMMVLLGVVDNGQSMVEVEWPP